MLLDFNKPLFQSKMTRWSNMPEADFSALSGVWSPPQACLPSVSIPPVFMSHISPSSFFSISSSPSQPAPFWSSPPDRHICLFTASRSHSALPPYTQQGQGLQMRLCASFPLFSDLTLVSFSFTICSSWLTFFCQLSSTSFSSVAHSTLTSLRSFSRAALILLLSYFQAALILSFFSSSSIKMRSLLWRQVICFSLLLISSSVFLVSVSRSFKAAFSLLFSTSAHSVSQFFSSLFDFLPALKLFLFAF